MLTKEELKIIDLFKKDLFKDYTIKEIMENLSKSSYNWTFRTVKKLNKLKLINISKRGQSNSCSINLDNKITITYLSLLEELEANSKNLPHENVSNLIDSIPLSYFTFIVAGSYAKGKATKKSDLDIVVLVENKTDTKSILTILKNKGEFMVPEVHPFVFTKKEFLKMLLSDEENYGKLVYKNRLILIGAENYYFIIKEAIKNGFKG